MLLGGKVDDHLSLPSSKVISSWDIRSQHLTDPKIVTVALSFVMFKGKRIAELDFLCQSFSHHSYQVDRIDDSLSIDSKDVIVTFDDRGTLTLIRRHG